MRRINHLLLAFILALYPVWSQSVIVFVKKKAAAGGPSFILNEDAEGVGQPAGWSNDGTVDWDEVVTVLAGIQSLELPGNAGSNARAYFDAGAAYDEVWVRFKLRMTTTAGPLRVFSFRNQTGDAEVCYLQTSAGNALTVVIGGNATTTSTLSINTNYNVWLHYIKGTGANATLSVGFSTTDTEPTSGNDFAAVTNGTATAQVNRFQWRTQLGAGNSYFVDSMTVDDAVIGNF